MEPGLRTYILKRVGFAVLMLVGVSIILFTIMRLAPGGPEAVLIGGGAVRCVVPELLVGDHADPPLLRGPPPAPAIGAERIRPRGRAVNARAARDPADPDARPDPDGLVHALHALEPSRGAASGLRP